MLRYYSEHFLFLYTNIYYLNKHTIIYRKKVALKPKATF